MKLASFAFFAILLLAHTVGDLDRLLGQPLSLFRDGETAWLGRAMFLALFLVGASLSSMLMRSHRGGEASVACLATFLLLAVAATDSFGEFHFFCSIMLLLTLFGYYAFLLFRANSFWVFGHLFVPMILGLATRLHSYGIWQKGFIVYFVIVCTIHHHLLARQLPGRRNRDPEKRKKRWKGELIRRRVGET